MLRMSKYAGHIRASNGRTPQNENKVPFKEILPLTLKDRVSGKGNSVKESGCLYEISLFFNCMKTNEFQESLCTQESGNFQKCYDDYLTKTRFNRAQRNKGILKAGTENLSHEQITMVLRKFPNK